MQLCQESDLLCGDGNGVAFLKIQKGEEEERD